MAAQEACTEGGARASWLDLEPGEGRLGEGLLVRGLDLELGVGGEGRVDEGTFTRSAACGSFTRRLRDGLLFVVIP